MSNYEDTPKQTLGSKSVKVRHSIVTLTHSLARLLKPGSHLCDKHKHKHKHKLATFPHVKQAQENKAYASAVTLEQIWKYSRWRMNHLACA